MEEQEEQEQERRFFLRLPKAELHAHLNGSISSETMKKLMAQKPDLQVRNGMTMIDKGQKRSLEECFQMFQIIHQITNRTEDILMVTKDVIREFAADGVKYLELRSTPRDEQATGMTKRTYVEAVLEGIRQCKEEKLDIDVRFLISVDRRGGPAVAKETVKLAEEFLLSTDGVVVGLDLSGNPTAGHGKDFLEPLLEAKNAGLRLALHLAEIPGQDEETKLFLGLPPDRIGHGTFLHSSASEDLIQLVRHHRVPLELCMTSNLKGQTVPSSECHHFGFWYNVGHPVALCGSNFGLHLVLQMTSAADRPKPLEFRIHKEQAYLHSKLLQPDLEKNHSGRLDGKLSPVSRTRKVYVPVTANLGDIPSLDLKHISGSVSPFSEGSFLTPAKHRIRHGCHSAGSTISDNISCGNSAFPLVHRNVEEKIRHSDRLTLERQKLTVCPIIDGEEHLRLLNFQHNYITRIQNISNLQQLVFLDLYDNQIEEISGLSTLKSLRVLLLGNNRIQKISNLEALINLDVLDLHGNQIARIENLNHLSSLRVLNLARNGLTCVENINGLESLAELNLRYNQIASVKDVNALPCLQRLFLSFNNISCFDDILCLADSSSLSDITLDGNPIAQETWYKHTVLHHMMQLRQLDMKKITEEERRMASVAIRKEEEKRRESHKQALLKEKKRLTISNIARQWETQQNRFAFLSSNQESNTDDDSCQDNQSDAFGLSEETRSLDSLLSKTVQGLSAIDSHLVEVEGDTLYLYGLGALESLDRNWSVQTAGNIATIAFVFIDFDEIVPVLPKLRIKFPNFVHLKFKETNLVTLQQFNALAQVRRMEQLTVDAQGNRVVSFALWKYYVLFRLSHFNLQKINGVEVTQNDVVMAEKLFGILACVASSDLPYCRLLSLLGETRKKQLCYLLEAKGKKSGAAGEEASDRRKLGGENMSRSVLSYTTRDSQAEKLEEAVDRKKFCHAYIQDLVKEAADINTKNESLQKLWPQMFIELVRDAVIKIRSEDSYTKLCLQQIASQKS